MAKLLFVYQNYRASYTGIANSWSRAFNDSVSEYSSFEFRPFTSNSLLNRILFRIAPIKILFFKYQNQLLFKVIKRDHPEMVFILKGTDLLTATLQRIKREFPEIKLACFNPDDPFNPKACGENIRSALKWYDSYFIWSRKLRDKLLEHGVKRVAYIPFATDSEIIYRIADLSYKYDISFIGNCDEERQRQIKEVIDLIEGKQLSINCSVFGHGWKPYKCLQIHGQVNGLEYLNTIARSKINLNILRDQNKGSTNMKTFEIPGAGGFMMHEASDEAGEIFIESKSSGYYTDANDLISKCQWFLQHDEERETIKERGHKVAIAKENSYHHRAISVINFMNAD